MVTVLYFAWLRERIGTGEERLTLPPGIGTVTSLIDWLSARGDGYRAAFVLRDVVRCAVNQQFGTPSTPVTDGDEIAFYPPVTGG
jgi:molybdopterin converting factor subunit 1